MHFILILLSNWLTRNYYLINYNFLYRVHMADDINNLGSVRRENQAQNWQYHLKLLRRKHLKLPQGFLAEKIFLVDQSRPKSPKNLSKYIKENHWTIGTVEWSQSSSYQIFLTQPRKNNTLTNFVIWQRFLD